MNGEVGVQTGLGPEKPYAHTKRVTDRPPVGRIVSLAVRDNIVCAVNDKGDALIRVGIQPEKPEGIRWVIIDGFAFLFLPSFPISNFCIFSNFCKFL